MKGVNLDFLSDMTYYLMSRIGIKTVDNFEVFLSFFCVITGMMFLVYFLKRGFFKDGTYSQSLFKGSKSFFFAITSILIFRATFFEPFRVSESDMEPDLKSYSHVIINKIGWGIRAPLCNRLISFREPKRDEILMVNYLEETEQVVIKRLARAIGLPGDTVLVNYATKKATIKTDGGTYEFQFKGNQSSQSKSTKITVPRDSVLLFTDTFTIDQIENPQIVPLENIIGSIAVII
jgi:signal peptidase I